MDVNRKEPFLSWDFMHSGLNHRQKVHNMEAEYFIIFWIFFGFLNHFVEYFE
jgi:hypothetical protein